MAASPSAETQRCARSSTNRLSRFSRDPKSIPHPGLGAGIAKRRGLRRAAVAVSRKLAVLMHRIWADRTEYRWQREAAVEDERSQPEELS